MPVTKERNDAVWQTWIEKGRERKRRSNLAHATVLNAASLPALAGPALGSDFPRLQIVVRLLVAVSAIVIMFQAIHLGQYVLATAFGAFIVIYNALAPAFGFAGHWQRATVAASAAPFVASVVSDYPKAGRNNE